jgi:hypothetical protein
MNQPRTIIWAGHVVCREDMINAYMVLVKKFERRRAFDRGILKLSLMGGCEEDSSGSEWGTVAGSREKENRLSFNIKCMKFLDYRQNTSFPKTILRH